MLPGRWPKDLPSIGAITALASLSSALGAVISDNLKGLPAGLVCGIALALAPYLARRLLAFLFRRDGLPRFVAREIAAIALAAGASLGEWLSRVTRPIANASRGPLLVAELALGLLTVLGGDFLRSLARPLATPLGVANVAAAAVLAGDVAGIPAASLAVFAGLPAMILLLLVNVSEAAAADR